MVLSAGILLYRIRDSGFEVWIAHMGGPFWARKDDRAWSLPKGEYDPTELPLAAAKREFEEEIGVPAPSGDYIDLGRFRQSSGKVIAAFALASDLEVDEVHSNTFPMEWPPRSGLTRHFPEIDRAAWVTADVARIKLVKGQVPIVDALEVHLAGAGSAP